MVLSTVFHSINSPDNCPFSHSIPCLWILVRQLIGGFGVCFLAHSTTKDYIRAEGEFRKRYKVERTNKAEIRPEEQSGKAEGCQENLWNEIQLKGL